MKKNKNTWFFIGGVLLIVVLTNLISLEEFLRFDLTRDQKFTLSEASVETVQNLTDTMTVSAYFTEGLPPPYAQHARYVKDLLEEYLAASTGKFAFEFTDPTAAETEEDKEKKKEMKRDIFGRLIREPTSIETELGDLGLQPVEIRVIEDDQQQTKRAYMGIVIRYQEKHEVIPVVQNLSDLEKDMTSFMRKLTRVREPKLGLIKDIAGPRIDKVMQSLKQNMAVDPIDLTAEGSIADDFDALLVIGSGKHFGDQGAEKIDEFLKKGKSAAIMLDRFQVEPRSFQYQAVGLNSKTQNVFDLVKSYGIEIAPSLVADASCASLNLQENRGGFVFSLPVKYPFVPELMNLSYDSVITKGLSGVILPFVSPLITTEKDDFKIKILAKSSKVSWLEKEPLDLNPRRDWGESNIEPDGPHSLIAEARGTLAGNDRKTNEVEDAKDQRSDSRLIVIGTSAFMWDDFLTQANQVLALNIVDWMLADSALLEMRAREFADAPLDADLSDATRQAVKYGNILGVPFLLVIYGLIRWRMRESRRRSLKINR
jgi:gliding-associated putative ABC transporter substrate-binding component GldG